MEIEGIRGSILIGIFCMLSYKVQTSKTLEQKFQLKLNPYICVFQYTSKFLDTRPQRSLVYHSGWRKSAALSQNFLTPRQFLNLIQFS